MKTKIITGKVEYDGSGEPIIWVDNEKVIMFHDIWQEFQSRQVKITIQDITHNRCTGKRPDLNIIQHTISGEVTRLTVPGNRRKRCLNYETNPTSTAGWDKSQY